MIPNAPDRTRCGSDSLTAINAEEPASVEVHPSTAQATYSAKLLRSCSSSMKQGKTANARHSQGRIITGLRPTLSESQPPNGSHTTPQRPTTAVAPKAI